MALMVGDETVEPRKWMVWPFSSRTKENS